MKRASVGEEVEEGQGWRRGSATETNASALTAVLHFLTDRHTNEDHKSKSRAQINGGPRRPCWQEPAGRMEARGSSTLINCVNAEHFRIGY